MPPFFQTLISTIIGAIFGGSGVTFLTFLIQRHDKKTDKRQEEYTELSRKISEIADAVKGQGQGLRIGFMDSVFSEQLKTSYLSIKNLGAKMFWWGWDTMALTNEIVEFLSENSIDYECGDFKSYSAINTYLSAEYAWYCTGMEIQGAMSPLIGQHIENSI